jgi:tubulin polyglutamylase TTLL6/13
MLDAELKPWLLEVNHTPSFQVETPVDEIVKSPLLRDALEII